MLNDFKAFIARGNILDLAIAVIMGAAFGAIVKTFTDGIIMPIIGFLTGGIDFKDKVINLGEMPVATPEQIAAAQTAKQPMIMYGQFINDVITFLIVALVMFALARYALRLFNTFQAAPTPPTGEEVLLAEIRDLLKTK
ncbi:MAG: large conductance mechanosensitive channel protein MscL [Acidobacteria bacterium]|jgi:large conductance mechanosensitive channel|nr:large conductance mechanosensitive channel protein MscL [Acidobacteriota bacterium]